jgi:hypothetical protein
MPPVSAASLCVNSRQNIAAPFETITCLALASNSVDQRTRLAVWKERIFNRLPYSLKLTTWPRVDHIEVISTSHARLAKIYGRCYERHIDAWRTRTRYRDTPDYLHQPGKDY